MFSPECQLYHSFVSEKITRTATLKCILKYYEYQRSNTGTICTETVDEVSECRECPEKRVTNVTRESSTKIMGIELHAIELYVSASANGMDTVNSATSTRDVVGGEANAQDIAKKNMAVV